MERKVRHRSKGLEGRWSGDSCRWPNGLGMQLVNGTGLGGSPRRVKRWRARESEGEGESECESEMHATWGKEGALGVGKGRKRRVWNCDKARANCKVPGHWTGGAAVLVWFG